MGLADIIRGTGFLMNNSKVSSQLELKMYKILNSNINTLENEVFKRLHFQS